MKKFKLQGRANRARRRGSALMIFGAGLVALFGFAAVSIDYGFLVLDARRLQSAADAAALAGATELAKSGTTAEAIAYDTVRARELAMAVAKRNGVTNITNSQVTFPTFNTIRVTPSYSRKHYFAQLLGFDSSGVARSATAGRLPIRGIRRAVPLAMTTDDYYANLNNGSFWYTLVRNQDTDFVKGTVASLDLRSDNSGASGAVFQDDLTDGFNGAIYLGQKINNALTASISSQGDKMNQAMQTRLGASEDRRIMYLVVAYPNPAQNGNALINAQFFVRVYVEASDFKNGNNARGRVRFRILPWDSQDPNIIVGDSTTPFVGQSVVSLMQ